jgi:hypothetical protein
MRLLACISKAVRIAKMESRSSLTTYRLAPASSAARRDPPPLLSVTIVTRAIGKAAMICLVAAIPSTSSRI